MSWQNVFKKFQIFQRRYCKSLQVKGLQSCGLSNFQSDPIFRESNLSYPNVVPSGPSSRIFSVLQRQLTTLHPFDLQTLAALLWKHLKSLKIIFQAHKTSIIFGIGLLSQIDHISIVLTSKGAYIFFHDFKLKIPMFV